MVVKCSTINFLLKNTDEQDAIIISFQRFLNSLDFPIQVLVRSKKLDIESYLSNLNEKAIRQTNQLLQNQTYELLYVVSGKLKAEIYSDKKDFLYELILSEGDTLILLNCGHGYEILMDNTKVLEVKNGPYFGAEQDRIRF